MRSARVLMVLLLITGIACRRTQKKIIGVVPQGQSHIFWQSIHAGALAAGAESGVEVEWNGPPNEGDPDSEIKVVDAMINRRLDAICLAPADEDAMVGVVERAAREKIPVIIFDTGVDTDAYVSRVATDNYGAGEIAARRMGVILRGKGRVVMLAVQPGIASSMAREQGFEDAIHREFPGIRIVDKRYGMADFAKSLAVAENMLTAYPELDGLFASNESSTVGAAQALKARPGKLKMVGFDWSPTLAADLRAGLIDSLVVQDPFQIGYQSVQAAVLKLRGGTPRKIVDLPARLVTLANLNDPAIQQRINPPLERYLPGFTAAASEARWSSSTAPRSCGIRCSRGSPRQHPSRRSKRRTPRPRIASLPVRRFRGWRRPTVRSPARRGRCPQPPPSPSALPT